MKKFPVWVSEDETGFTDFGQYYGFPQCCIDDFGTRFRAPEEKRKLCGTGFIPCLKCNQKSEAELIEIINANRKCPIPFPNGELAVKYMRDPKDPKNVSLWKAFILVRAEELEQ